ncbi:hypothetical protein PLESTB_000089600 [Pleodorina starrii]|uniref:Uncharacterized protein n=1 Tax=Pleodorina starrii TaxID=330485 RepID=A0A9W6BAB7_9CHLO|nr:hypothetical protein PLESTB_000089600 [Pleodorina starrii]GLC76581.1 hypothetical protein PLESTF_001799800 [Pleodorina starrii]
MTAASEGRGEATDNDNSPTGRRRPFRRRGEACPTPVPPVLLCWVLLVATFWWRGAEAQQTPPPAAIYGPWYPSQDLNEQHKAVLRFILSGNTSFWSRPEVATRIGFGTAPWRCVDNCRAQYYASSRECAPDCSSQTYCEPGGPALSDPNTTCCALSILDQSYSFSHPPSASTPTWCSNYPAWGTRVRQSVCDFNAFSARGASPPGGAANPFLAVSCKKYNTTTVYYVNGTLYRNDTARRLIRDNDIRRRNTTRNLVTRISLRHIPAWHHPTIDITRPPEFSLVDDLVCLPLQEL